MHTSIQSHGLKRSLHPCPRRVDAGNKNTPSMHHPRRRNMTTSVVGFKNKQTNKQTTTTTPITYAKIAPQNDEPGDIALAGNAEEEEDKEGHIRKTQKKKNYPLFRGV